MKPFTNYQVTPSFTNYQVARRYKHFDWLHQRLQAKYGKLIPIPPLPEKQLTGIFEEEVIEERMVLLQQFKNRICRHPVLSSAEVWRHFLI
jgi:sorting nexin-9/18/33